jgi:hypothetical protein
MGFQKVFALACISNITLWLNWFKGKHLSNAKTHGRAPNSHTTDPWKQNQVFLCRALLVTEYQTTTKFQQVKPISIKIDISCLDPSALPSTVIDLQKLLNSKENR